MLIWLASFPRSGSALTQVILWQCFGLITAREGDWKSRTEGQEADKTKYFGPNPGLEQTFDAYCEAARRSPDPRVVKTHQMPGDTLPALVVVRDGRPVMRSFGIFRTLKAGVATTTGQIIDHRHWNWSAHCSAWLDRDAPQLVLRYEDLREPSDEILDRIGAFLQRDRIGDFTARIEDLRAMRPNHVGTGANADGIAEIESDFGDLFWTKHGSMMDRLGYSR